MTLSLALAIGLLLSITASTRATGRTPGRTPGAPNTIGTIGGDKLRVYIINGSPCPQANVTTTGSCNAGNPDFDQEGAVCDNNGTPTEAYCTYALGPAACAYCCADGSSCSEEDAVDPCDAICDLPGDGVCESEADASKPECADCIACQTNNRPLDPCSAICDLPGDGVCASMADASKPECADCIACQTNNGPAPALTTAESSASVVDGSGSGSGEDNPRVSTGKPYFLEEPDNHEEKSGVAVSLRTEGHTAVDVVEVNAVIAGLTCAEADTTIIKSALSAVVVAEFIRQGGTESQIVAAITIICPNRYVARRRRQAGFTDFSTELVTAGAPGPTASTANGNFDYGNTIPGVDTSGVGATATTASQSFSVETLADSTGVTRFGNLIVDGQEIYDNMAVGTRPSQYGVTWGTICSGVGTDSAGCPSWGKFDWCQPENGFYDAVKGDGTCSTANPGIGVVDGKCFTCQ